MKFALFRSNPRSYQKLVLALLFLATAVNYVDRQTLSIIAPVLQNDIDLSPRDYSPVLFVFLLGYTISQTLAGHLIDKVGTRIGMAFFVALWSVVSMFHFFIAGLAELQRPPFGIPVAGSLGLLALCVLGFIAANLAVGFTFSTLARNQMQAMQMSIFFFLPSMLLSGFLFPFRGMPEWAQFLGNLLPLTWFLRIVRGILLKGNGWMEVWPELWPILGFVVVVSAVALKRYRQTLA